MLCKRSISHIFSRAEVTLKKMLHNSRKELCNYVINKDQSYSTAQIQVLYSYFLFQYWNSKLNCVVHRIYANSINFKLTPIVQLVHFVFSISHAIKEKYLHTFFQRQKMLHILGNHSLPIALTAKSRLITFRWAQMS